MKRKVKKGIKQLTSLIEGAVTYDAKEALNSSSPLMNELSAINKDKDKEPNESEVNGENQLKN